MIKMWKDYYEMVLKPSFKWLKLHWFGYVIWCLICLIISFGCIFFGCLHYVDKCNEEEEKGEES